MHVFGAFELDIRPGTSDHPASVKIALLRYTRGEDGRLFITPECATFEEIEGQINSCRTSWAKCAREPATATPLVPCRGSDTRRSIADYRPNEAKRDRAFLLARRRCRR